MHSPKVIGGRYRWWPLDINIEAQVAGLGNLKVIIRPLTMHSFYWLDAVYLGRVWSLNQMRETIFIDHADDRIELRFTWFPTWRLRILRKGADLGSYKLTIEMLRYWMMSVMLSLILFLPLAYYVGTRMG